MKKVIIYATKTGTTEKCANILSSKLEDTKVINISKENIDLNQYDVIIIGAPIRMGMIDTAISKFLKSNLNTLLTKKIAFFICCCFENNLNQYIDANIPKELADLSVAISCFGGELDIEKQKGFSKLIIKLVAKSNNNDVKIIEENIELFSKKIKEI